MPFWLYSIDRQGLWHQETRLVFARVLSSFVRSRISDSQSGPWRNLSWHASESELIKRAKEESGNDFSGKAALIIDLKPKSKDVSLYRIEHVWGFSYERWTPVALRLQGLFVDHRVRGPKRFKKIFKPPPRRSRHNDLHEFLYLGHDNGVGKPWGWGRTGSVNAALLWPDAFESLVGSIQKLGLNQPES